MAVGYVHQRVEIVKAGYRLQESRKCLANLIDQNSRLMYNLAKLESPKSLLSTLDAEKIKFANRRTQLCDKYGPSASTPEKNYDGGGVVGRFMDLFMASAEAKTR